MATPPPCPPPSAEPGPPPRPRPSPDCSRADPPGRPAAAGSTPSAGIPLGGLPVGDAPLGGLPIDDLDAAPREPVPREIRVLIAAAFLIAIGFGLIAPILPQFARSFDVGVAAAGMIVSVFALTRLLFAPVSGRLTDRLGEPIVYVGGVLTVAVSTILCGLAGDYAQLMFFRGLGGIGSTMFTVSAMTMIARLSPPSMRGRISGMYATAFLTGNIAGPIVGGLLAGLGYRLPFFLYGGTLVLAAGLVFVLLRHAGSGSRGNANAKPPMSVREALGVPTYRAALCSGFANGWSTFGVRTALVPLFAAQTFLHGDAYAGVALALFAAGNALSQPFAGRVSDHYGRKVPLMSGLAVASLAMAGIGFTSSIPLFLALAVISGVGTGFMNPAQQAAVADVVGPDRTGGKVLATFQMSADFGAILGPVLAGLIADRLGFGFAFGMTAAIGLLGAAAWLPVRTRRPA